MASTYKKYEHYFQHIDVNTPELIDLLAARYGFNPATLKHFFNSPAGKILKNIIANEYFALEELKLHAREAAQAAQREKALYLLLLDRLEAEAEAKAERREHLFEQELLEHQLEAQKTNTKQQTQSSAAIYEASAIALNDALKAETERLTELHAEWDALEAALEQHEAHDAFLDDLHQNPERLFDDLSDEEALHLDAFKNPALQLLRKDFKKVSKNGEHYLIERHQNFEDLSSSDKHKARKAFQNIPKNIHEVRQEQAHHIEAQKNALIAKSTPVHRNIRSLTQALIFTQRSLQSLEAKPAPNKAHQKANHAALSLSYRLLYRESLVTTQKAPLLSALHEDVDPLDLTAINRVGGLKLLPELHQFKQGASGNTSAARMQSQTLLSLLKNAESLAALVSEAPTARRFHMQEQSHVPKPKPQPAAKPQPEPESKVNHTFHPSPFKTRPQ